MADEFGLSQMSASGFMRVAKLKGSGKLLEAGRHNRREIQAELGAASHIDASRSNLNYSLAGPDTAKEVSELAKRLMADAGATNVRKDCVRAIEFLFSLPFGFQGNQREFFTACLTWCASRFGGLANVLSFDVHNDETNPHAHCLILPLLDGKMKGSDMVGGRKVLASHQESFQQEVGVRFGLSRGPKQLRSIQKAEISKQVIDRMKRTNDASMKSLAWQSIRAAIESNPVPFAQAFGLVIESQPKKSKTFAQIMTAPTTPESSKRVISNPIGFDKVVSQKEQTLSCVGFGISKAPIPAPIVDDYTRISEDQLPVESYDSDRGEFSQQAKQPDRKSSGSWLIGDSIKVSKRSMPTLEQAQKIFAGQMVRTSCDFENETFHSQQASTIHRPNQNKQTRWSSFLRQGKV